MTTTNDLDDFKWPARPKPRQVVIPVSQIPTHPRRRIWPRWVWLVLLIAMIFEPVRIIACVLVFFWIMAIGCFPHVAAFKVLTGTHK